MTEQLYPKFEELSQDEWLGYLLRLTTNAANVYSVTGESNLVLLALYLMKKTDKASEAIAGGGSATFGFYGSQPVVLINKPVRH